MKRLALLLALVLLSTGCMGRHGVGTAIFATGLLVGAALSDHHPVREHEHVTYVYVGPPAPVVPLSGGGSWRDRVPANDDAPAFAAQQARAALGAVDLAGCRAAGATRGYGHAKVTFNPSGDISKVVIDEPSGLPDAAAKCIGDRLGTAKVSEFRGSLVTVGTSWFVP